MVGSQFLLVDVGANGWLFGASLNLLGASPPDGMAIFVAMSLGNLVDFGCIPPCNGTLRSQEVTCRLSGDLDSSTLDVFQHDHHLVAS